MVGCVTVPTDHGSEKFKKQTPEAMSPASWEMAERNRQSGAWGGSETRHKRHLFRYSAGVRTQSHPVSSSLSQSGQQVDFTQRLVSDLHIIISTSFYIRICIEVDLHLGTCFQFYCMCFKAFSVSSLINVSVMNLHSAVGGPVALRVTSAPGLDKEEESVG